MTDVSRDGSTLVFVRELRHEPTKVWRALTEPDELAKWSPFTVDRSLTETGAATLTMIDGEEHTELPGIVRRAEPPTLLEYTWGDDVLEWRLEPVDGGTRLTLRHTVEGLDMVPKVAAGWHLCVDVLEEVLAGTDPDPIRGHDAMNHGWQELHDRYERELATEQLAAARQLAATARRTPAPSCQLSCRAADDRTRQAALR
jgi:uncharacterized protein YndB with AHSA1/START domain